MGFTVFPWTCLPWSAINNFSFKPKDNFNVNSVDMTVVLHCFFTYTEYTVVDSLKFVFPTMKSNYGRVSGADFPN